MTRFCNFNLDIKQKDRQIKTWTYIKRDRDRHTARHTDRDYKQRVKRTYQLQNKIGDIL